MRMSELVGAAIGAVAADRGTGLPPFFRRELMDKVAHHENVDTERQRIHADLAAEHRRHDAAVTEIKARMVANQARCQHLLTTRFDDPGNPANSYTRCELCGAETDKHP